MKRRRKLLIVFALVVAVIYSGTWAAYRIYSEVFSGMWDLPILLAESKSPANLGEAAFLKDSGFTASGIEFYVFDSTITSQPIFVGGPYSSDGNAKMQQAVWSKDGSVVAVRAKFGVTSGHKFTSYFGEFFADAYDFRMHKTIGERSDMYNRALGITNLSRNSQLIAGLMARRGGRGQTALASPYGAFSPSREISKQEASIFKRPGSDPMAEE